jgi:hypothetical protein
MGKQHVVLSELEIHHTRACTSPAAGAARPRFPSAPGQRPAGRRSLRHCAPAAPTPAALGRASATAIATGHSPPGTRQGLGIVARTARAP